MSLSDPTTKCGLCTLADIEGKVRFTVEGIFASVCIASQVLGRDCHLSASAAETQARALFAMGHICKICSSLTAEACGA